MKVTSISGSVVHVLLTEAEVMLFLLIVLFLSGKGFTLNVLR